MTKSFYITTPIFYPNTRLHLGHAYSMTMADIIARYKKSRGYQVYFQTGSDNHGEKIEKKAQLTQYNINIRDYWCQFADPLNQPRGEISAAQRISWASRREITRVEDIAYTW